MIGCGVLALSPQSATAQILEELQVQPDNFENVVRLQFNARIQFLRAVTVGKSNTIQVYFQLVQSEDIGGELKTVETLNKHPGASDAEIANEIENLCLCGTYNRVRAAIRRVVNGQ